jgi:hypothetical protein
MGYSRGVRESRSGSSRGAGIDLRDLSGVVKAIHAAGRPGHYVLGQASFLQKLVEGELQIERPEPLPGNVVPWDTDPYRMCDDAAVVYKASGWTSPSGRGGGNWRTCDVSRGGCGCEWLGAQSVANPVATLAATNMALGYARNHFGVGPKHSTAADSVCLGEVTDAREAMH